MITPNRYSVQFMEERWKTFNVTLFIDDLSRAKKLCAATVAYNPHVWRGRVVDRTITRGELPDDGVIYSVDNEREAVKLLRRLMRLEVV